MRDVSITVYYVALTLLVFLVLLGRPVTSNVDKEVRLRVSVRKESLEKVPSCQHSISQVELVNMHNSEPIQIHSIQLTGESTVLLSSDKQQKLFWESSTYDESVSSLPITKTSYPQQVRVSRLPSGTLSLGPGQVAIVPVTFLPHYPQTIHSPTASADSRFFDLPRHNNRESLSSSSSLTGSVATAVSQPTTISPQLSQITARVEVKTSRGLVQLPITASSIRHNDYNLPDVIYFEEKSSSSYKDQHNGVIILDSDTFGFNRSATSTTISSIADNSSDIQQQQQQQQSQTSECFDVHVSNPSSDEQIDVTELIVSRPELMALQVDPEKLEEEPPFFIVRRLSTPTQVIRVWSETGPLTIQPKSTAYVAAVCMGSVVPEEEASEEVLSWEGPNSLGFLQVRTSKDTLFISLERKHTSSLYKRPSFYSPSSSFDSTSLSNDKNISASCASDMSKDNKSCKNSDYLYSSNTGQLLQPIPSSIDFHLLSSETKTSSTSIGFKNNSPKKITFVRAAVGVHATDYEENDWIQNIGLQLNISIGGNDYDNNVENDYENSKKVVQVKPMSTIHEAIWLSCSVDWDAISMRDLDSLSFTGALVIRATSADPTSWMESIHKHPLGNPNSDYIIEVPYSVSIIQGKLGVMIHKTTHPFPHLWAVKPWKAVSGLGSVSSIFFPQRPFEVRGEVDGDRTEPIFSAPAGIDHKLRIFTNMQLVSISLTNVKVVDKQKKDSNDSVCDRFKLTISNDPPSDDFPFDGFTDIGMVSIHYTFPDSQTGDREDNNNNNNNLGGEIQYSSEPAYPTTCYLMITTTPQTEIHQIPLIVYPGQLDVTATQSPLSSMMDDQRGIRNTQDNKKSTKEDNKNEKSNIFLSSKINHHAGLEDASFDSLSKAVVGFDVLLSWFKTSAVGAALKSVLTASMISSRQKSKLSEVNLLGEYIYNLCSGIARVESSILRPILLKVGAIEQGEMETSSFYLTNHNPIPLLVSIDVGEVEGMSVSLGRGMTRVRADESNVLNHFPFKHNNNNNNETEPLVPDGIWKGHPLKGLRKFLMTDDVALSFFSHFPFKDAISLSETAVRRQPLLGMLYNKYAFGEFHRDQLPIRLGRDGWSRCDGTTRPARYGPLDNDAASAKLQGGQKPGPLILSGDTSVLQPLNICWDKHGEPIDYPSDGTFIIIPPGGVARFELRLHAPPSSYLKDDITRFLATGLVLSTDHGEVLPIFVSFEALQGKLQVSHVPAVSDYMPRCFQEFNNTREEENENFNTTIIHVPAGLFEQPTKARGTTDGNANVKVTIPAGRMNCSSSAVADTEPELFVGASKHGISRSGVSLYVKSSFSREVRLLKMSSCNPWFQVVLQGTENMNNNETNPTVVKEEGCGESSFGFNIGTVSSKVYCGVPGEDDETNNNMLGRFPSFYQCALNWLSNRADLQPRGCGLLPTVRSSRSGSSTDDTSSSSHLAEHGGVERAIQAFERALLISRSRLRGTGGGISGTSGNVLAAGSSHDPEKKNTIISQLRSHEVDGFVSPVILNVFAEAWDAWRVVSDFGLRALTSSLRATIEYDAVGVRGENDADNAAGKRGRRGKGTEPTTLGETTIQNLSVSMRDLAIETVLSTPKLFDCARALEKAPFAETSDDESPSVMEFPSTLVANLASLMIPLRNPTSVPIRVRLAAAPSDLSNEFVDEGEFRIDDNIRDRFIESHGAPYVQNGKFNASLMDNAEHLWWDGDGAYFISDNNGDLIRSHHSIRIRAGAGAHVSLVNPSLHASTALLVGCGARCGIREDPSISKSAENEFDPKILSPFGASAAAGITLVGRKRSSLPQVNIMVTEEPYISAGASFAGNEGPPSFAIPYSALHEIVIPPYGEAEVGPVLFRPPGRFSVHGCDAVRDSHVSHISPKKSKACESNMFQSMVFLENSLTGLERVVLRGKAMLERVFFLDPLPEDDMDAFGDVEHRNGRAALIFSGTRADTNKRDPSLPKSKDRFQGASKIPGAVVKEVVVHNGGDVRVDFAHAYLSDSARLREKRFVDALRGGGSPCTFGSFRLLNCWEVDEPDLTVNGVIVRNVRNGFELLPGQNHSIFIEHIPNCGQHEEFIVLNLDIRRDRFRTDAFSSRHDNIYSLSRSGEMRLSKANNWRNSFRERKLDLLVGYDMSLDEFRSCKPAAQRGHRVHDIAHLVRNSMKHTNASFGFNVTSDGHYVATTLDMGGIVLAGFEMLVLLSTTTILSVFVISIARGYLARERASLKFSSKLRGPNKHKGDTCESSGSPESPADTGHSTWTAAFRCLARADPTSSELQTLGREQIRQVVLGRYRSMGVLPPQCFNSAGIFVRERPGSATSPRRQIHGGKDGNAKGGNDRVRRLSDAIFQNFSTNRDTVGTGIVPVGLGWRAAFSRGIIDEASMDTSSTLELTSNRLLVERSNREKTLSSEKDDYEDDDEDEDDDDEEGDSAQYSDGEYDQLGGGETNSMEESSIDDETEVPDDSRTEHRTSMESVISTSNSEGTDLHKEETISTKGSHESSIDGDAKANDESDVKSNVEPANKHAHQVKQEITKNGGAPAKVAPANDIARQAKAESSNPVSISKSKLQREAKRERERERQRERERDRENRTRKADAADSQAQEVSPDAPLRKQVQVKDGGRSKKNELRNSLEKPKGRANQEKGKIFERKNSQRDRRGGNQGSAEPSSKERQDRRLVDDGSVHSGRKKRPSKAERSSKKPPKEAPPSSRSPSSSDVKDGAPRSNEPKVEKKQVAAADKEPIPSSPSLPVVSNENPVIPPKKMSPVLRPPPGLAPPPGFSEADSNPRPSGLQLPLNMPSFSGAAATDLLPTTSSLLNERSLLSTLPTSGLVDSPFRMNPSAPIKTALPPLPLNTSLPGVTGASPPPGHPILGVPGAVPGVSSIVNNSVHSTSNGPPASHSVQLPSVPAKPLLSDNNGGYMTGFDVMDFLDNILNDGNASSGGSGNPNDQSGGNFLADAATRPLPSDPWATERQSRAAAYGISFEETVADEPVVSSPPMEPLSGAVSGAVEPLSSVEPLGAVGSGENHSSLSFLLESGAIPPPFLEDETNEDKTQSVYASFLNE